MISGNNLSNLGWEVDGFQIKVGEDFTDGGNFIIGFFLLIDNKQILIIKEAEPPFSFDGLGKEIFIHNPDVELGEEQIFQIVEDVFFVHSFPDGLDNRWKHDRLCSKATDN